MKHLFIINPTAGKEPRPEKLRDEILEFMKGRGEEYLVRFTERIGHAEDIVREVVSDGGEWRVYACGGDGTLNEAVNGMAGYSNAALTQMAYGTGNDFLRLFNPDDNTAFRDIGALVDGEEREFDLIETIGRYSINICSVGLDARIAGDVHRFSKLPLVNGFAAFTMSGIYHIFKGISSSYSISVDGENLDGRYALICVANARYYGGGYMPMADTDPTDGLLDLLLVGNISRMKALSVLKLYKEGRAMELGDLITRRRAKEIEIDFLGRTEQVNTDGEINHTDGCVMRVSNHKIRVFAPVGSFNGVDSLQKVSKRAIVR